MPLIDSRKLNDHQALATWEITEPEEELMAMVDVSIEDDFSEIHHEVKRKEWIVSRILTREVCSIFNIPYGGARKDNYGKPWLKSGGGYISVTHCYPIVSVIIDTLHEVGIDLERSREQIGRIAHRFMSKEEVEHDDHPDYQLILWASKEALYKLHGRKSLEFRTQLLVDPFEIDGEGVINGTIIDGEPERHRLYYRFFRDRKYVVVYSLE